MTPSEKTTPKTLPKLRDGLRYEQSQTSHSESPVWLIHDPVKNKFYYIGWSDYQILLRWDLETLTAIIESVNEETTLTIHEEDVINLCDFLVKHRLVVAREAYLVDDIIKHQKKPPSVTFLWLCKQYLFFRIPLVKPHFFLKMLAPYLRWVYSANTAITIFLLSLIGLFLASRQWESFTSTFIDQLSTNGLLSFGFALIFSKFVHEMGHAVTATHYGVRVGHMGVAMMLLFPMPYTDTSESWKLKNHWQRLHIASAGVLAELCLAGLATLGWSITPEGPVKSALFFLATTSWVLTLLVNLSPFLRFDGYFVLSDLLNFPNLHERSAAFGKRYLRKVLLGFEEAWPETLPNNLVRFLIGFSWFSWLYRLFVYVGIAWLIYSFFFKALGALLFVLALWWFIFLPCIHEIKVWMMRKNEIKQNRLIAGASLVISLLFLGLIPWQTSVSGEGWVHATKQQSIYTPVPGVVSALHQQGIVNAGDSIFSLKSPDIALKALQAQTLVNSVQTRLDSLGSTDNGKDMRIQLQLEKSKLLAQLSMYQAELEQLNITADFDGLLLDLHDHLKPGSWVSSEEPLAVLIDPSTWAADAFIAEQEVVRIQPGNKAKLMFDDGHFTVLEGVVMAVDATKLKKLPHQLLDVKHGGSIATLPNTEGSTTQALYKVRIGFNDMQHQFDKVMPVHVKINTQSEALLPGLVRRVAALFIRETGF